MTEMSMEPRTFSVWGVRRWLQEAPCFSKGSTSHTLILKILYGDHYGKIKTN